LPEHARIASCHCQSNLKQLGLGIMQYTQDYDEQFPYIRVGDPDTSLDQRLSPYVGQRGVNSAPKRQVEFGSAPAIPQRALTSVPQRVRRSYAAVGGWNDMNDSLKRMWQQNGAPRPR
jgi:hypothetical protein